ncbi:hypothetical protein K504DRAFT_466810 [Pleomassaria siparia CBS 279.74]|uniref:Diphthamide biosynthesis protein 4 n=1 Tax=Pleomassaria siparia CBS 279.74 TaxID=1314801 RepID=A0A6G1KCP3_9PLEO|nr:hypothetical protein K504DRAFT_466810 [Pleomassaria siparia CBS 279.74]
MSYSKNYYAILGLEAPAMRANSVSASEIKVAYKKALFTAHPDKSALRERNGKENLAVKLPNAQDVVDMDNTFSNTAMEWTVDHVKEAYTVLASTTSRHDYDAWLLAQYNEGLLKYGAGAGAEKRAFQDAFARGVLPRSFANMDANHTTYTEEYLAGLELLDLSDFDEVQSHEGGWKRDCRCGSDVGFKISESELEDAERKGGKEVVVECWGCSLCVRVGFESEEC